MNCRTEIFLLILAQVLLFSEIFPVEGKLKDGECEGQLLIFFVHDCQWIILSYETSYFQLISPLQDSFFGKISIYVSKLEVFLKFADFLETSNEKTFCFFCN